MDRKLLLVHGLKLYEYQGNYFPKQQGGFHTTETLKRFEGYAEEIIFLASVTHLDSEDLLQDLEPIKYKKLSVINIGNRRIPNLKSIERAVMMANYIILRVPSIISDITALYAKKHSKPYSCEVVGNCFEALWYHSIKGKIVAPFFNMLTKKTVYNSPIVTYITKEYLQSIYPTKGNSLDFIPNVSFNFSSPSKEERLQIRNYQVQKRIQSNKVKIGMIANYNVAYKNHEVLIRAISILFSKHPEFKDRILLELVSGGDHSNLSKIIAKNGLEPDTIVYVGMLPHNKLIKWLDTVDIYIQPSKTEAQGRSAIEAMSRGCQVITSNIGGMKEYVDEGWRFSVNNAYQLYQLILKAINMNTSEIMNIASKNIDAIADFDVNNIRDRRKSFLEQLINSEYNSK